MDTILASAPGINLSEIKGILSRFKSVCIADVERAGKYKKITFTAPQTTVKQINNILIPDYCLGAIEIKNRDDYYTITF